MEIEEKLHEILGAFGKKLEDDLVVSLEKNGVTGGGGTASKLAGSIRFIFLTGKDQGVGITMADYWDYVERGTKPSKYGKTNKHSALKIQSLIAWIKWKGGVDAFKKKNEELKTPKKLSQALEKLGHRKLKDSVVKRGLKQKIQDTQIKSLAFAIAANISKRGTSNRGRANTFTGPKGTHFVKEVMEDGRIEELTETIAKEIGITITVNIVDDLQRTL